MKFERDVALATCRSLTAYGQLVALNPPETENDNAGSEFVPLSAEYQQLRKVGTPKII